MAFQSRVGLFPCVPSVAIPHRQFACETADITPERRRDCTQLFERKIALSSFQQVAAGHKMAPAVGFEPTTNRLTADRSTTELRWIVFIRAAARSIYLAHTPLRGKSYFNSIKIDLKKTMS